MIGCVILISRRLPSSPHPSQSPIAGAPPPFPGPLPVVFELCLRVHQACGALRAQSLLCLYVWTNHPNPYRWNLFWFVFMLDQIQFFAFLEPNELFLCQSEVRDNWSRQLMGCWCVPDSLGSSHDEKYSNREIVYYLWTSEYIYTYTQILLYMCKYIYIYIYISILKQQNYKYIIANAVRGNLLTAIGSHRNRSWILYWASLVPHDVVHGGTTCSQ